MALIVDPADSLEMFKELVLSGALGSDMVALTKSIEEIQEYPKLSEFAMVIRRHAVTVESITEIIRSRARRFPLQREWLEQLVLWIEEGAS